MCQRKYKTLDLLRAILLYLVIIAYYGLPVSSVTDYIKPLFNFASCSLFVIYGFFIYSSDDFSYGRFIRRIFRAFLIMLLFDLILTPVFLQVANGQPWAYLNKRGVFDFIVLNRWGAAFGSSIWLLMSTLYALIVLWLADKLRLMRAGGIVAVILLILASVFGELAGCWGFSVRGFTNIPAGCFTRALPYMLIGKGIAEHRHTLYRWPKKRLTGILAGSAALCLLELLVLNLTGHTEYIKNLIGFPGVCFSLVVLTLNTRSMPEVFAKPYLLRTVFFTSYFLYSPIAECLSLAAWRLTGGGRAYDFAYSFIALITVVICIAVSCLISRIRNKMDKMYLLRN